MDNSDKTLREEVVMSEFESDKVIDPSRLDYECVRQPEVFFKYAQKAIKAAENADKAKLRMDVIKGTLEIDCRQHPDKYGLVKSTDNGVNSAVTIHPKYQKALSEYLEARRELKLMDAAVNAMEQKKRMLEVLVTLHGQQYFAGASVPRDLVSDYYEARGRVSEEVTTLQKQRTRKRGQQK